MTSSDLRTFIARDLRRHPRVAYQQLVANDGAANAIAEAVPPLSPFARPGLRDASSYRGAIAIVDWDHRLPSNDFVLRIFGYYTKASLASGEKAYQERLELIAARDLYPEFDVPDFSDLAADEAYEVDLDTDNVVGECRLTSAWRRHISRKDAARAEAVARASTAYRALEQPATRRPPQLGGLEAVSWTPPCESGHPRWAIDVWYLLSFDGRVATGQSFLVALGDDQVVSSRQITVRAG